MKALRRRFVYMTMFIAPLVLVVMTGCRTKPKLDPGYHPQSLSGPGVSGDLRPSGELPAATEGWVAFDGRAPAAGDQDFEELPDRRWGPIYFAFNQSFIGETERAKLEKLADYLVQNQEFQVIVEGHCDEQGSEEFNRVLGEKRALAVRDYLSSLNVDAKRIQTISYGEERPASPGRTEEAYARNRRAELIIGISKRR